MNVNAKILVSGLGALVIAGVLAATPAQARGGGGHWGGGFLGGFGDFASNISDTTSSTSNAVSNTPVQPYNKPCHKENRKLYDDNDNVVAHQVVMVCPAN